MHAREMTLRRHRTQHASEAQNFSQRATKPKTVNRLLGSPISGSKQKPSIQRMPCALTGSASTDHFLISAKTI